MNVRCKFWLVTVSALMGVALTASLGRWQLSRADEKLALQSAIESQGTRPELDTGTVSQVSDWKARVHQRAKVRGTWVPEATVYLDNRQMRARVGFFVLTPLRLEGSSPPVAVLVQRGWIARDFSERTRLPPVHTPAGLVEIAGRIAPAPSQLYEPGAPSSGVIRQNLDLTPFRVETGLPLAAFTLQQWGASDDGLLRDWPIINLGIDKHYGYAFQWFGLACLIAILYFWFQWVRPFLQRSTAASSDV